MEVGVSQPVGFRWFRTAGGMAPSHLSVQKAELRALPELCRAGGDCAVKGGRSWCAGRRLPPGTSAFDDLAGAAAQRGNARRQPGLPSDDRSVARGASVVSPESGEARDEPGAAILCSGSARGRHSCRWRCCGCRAGGGLERSTAWAASEPTMGFGMEPTADRQRLRLDYPDDTTMRISHEAIYQALYGEGRGALKRELTQCLRTGRALRVRKRARGARQVVRDLGDPHQRTSGRGGGSRGAGHWEGD